MTFISNQRGSVLVFMTVMIVLLLVMVGMGLDTGHLAYIRSQGQPAVDAAALAAASALPSGSDATVQARALAFNGQNSYLGSGTSQLVQNASVTFVSYNSSNGTMTKVPNAAAANGVRVAMEDTNPYGGSTTGAMNAPLFLTPLFKLFGISAPGTQHVAVRATAIIEGIPGMPIAINGCPPANSCATANGNIGTKCTLWQSSDGQDNSGWTTFTIGSANSNLIRQLIDNNGDCGSIPPISIGTCINLQNGQDNAALKHLGDVYSSNGNGFSGVNNSPFPEDCGLIPVVDTVKFNQCSPIVSWARLCLRDVDSHGGGKSITGDLTCNVSNIGKTDTKCYVPKLVRDAQSGM